MTHVISEDPKAVDLALSYMEKLTDRNNKVSVRYAISDLVRRKPELKKKVADKTTDAELLRMIEER